MQCEISVIVPIYQVENYIKDSITSIAQQSFRNFEVVLVNDGSTDSSVAIAENILSAHNVNYVVINQENKGLPLGKEYRYHKFIRKMDSMHRF